MDRLRVGGEAGTKGLPINTPLSQVGWMDTDKVPIAVQVEKDKTATSSTLSRKIQVDLSPRHMLALRNAAQADADHAAEVTNWDG